MTSVGELIGTIALDDKFSKPAGDVFDALGIGGASMKAMAGFAGIAAAAVTSAGAAIAYLGTRGAAVADVRGSFEQLTARAGQTADVMLGALRDGTQGTITDFELMKLANTALGSGLVTSAKDMETLSAGAKLLAGRVGGDTGDAFNKLTDAMAKGKTEALKQFGVFVDSKAAIEQYAAGIGKSASELTQQEKAAALSQAGLAALRKELEANGPAALSFGDIIDRGKVMLGNFVDGISEGVAASPVLRAGMLGIGTAIEEAFGARQEGMIQAIIGGVNRFAIFLVDAAGIGVEALRFLSNAWDGAKFGFNAFMELMVSAVSGAAGLLAGIAKNLESLPTVGKHFEGVTGVMKEVQAAADALGMSFGEQADEALDSADKSNAAFDSVRATLKNVSAAMEEAARAQEEVAAGAPPAAQGMASMGAAAQLTAQQIKQMQDEARRALEEQREMSAQARGDFQALQDELTLMNMTGVEARLEQLRVAEEEELAAVHAKRDAYGVLYDEMVQGVVAKYEQMRLAAQGMHSSVEAAAAAQGFSTREELERTAQVAQDTYERMKHSGLFTTAELERAHKAAEKAKQDATGETRDHQLTMNQAVLQGAQQLFGVLGEKYKAAAIAGAIIATYAAVAKSMASAPWPANLVLAAGALGAGLANVAKIRGAQAGFAEGTPGTSFVDFGRETVIAAHGEEAIVNRAQGATLAEVISGRVDRRLDAMDSQSAAEVRMLREEMSAQRRDLPLMLRDAMRLAMA